MKVKIGDTIQEYQSIWWEKPSIIKVIDQRKLPFRFEIFEATTVDDICFAIKDMIVRGAPLIGVTAAYGVALTANSFHGNNIVSFMKEIENACLLLQKTRPTAVDLFYNTEIMKNVIQPKRTIEENKIRLKRKADAIKNASIAECLAIGKIGNTLLTSKKNNIMTICNAGALAAVDIGTALAPIRVAHNEGKGLFIYINETRPRLQGAKLTAWELYNEGINHCIITDNAAGHFIQKGQMDFVIVGADRIARNGDVANKIGTYTLSVLCKEHNIPFYVAAPLSTFDFQTSTGREIPIEERDEIEVRSTMSVEKISDTNPKYRIIHHPYSPNKNPAFDITPSKNITGIITPFGIYHKPYSKSLTQSLLKEIDLYIQKDFFKQ